LILVPIVTSLDALRYHAIATTLRGAVVAATVIIDAITIVAVFNTGMNQGIATRRRRTVVQTGIGLLTVAVITNLKASLAFGNIDAPNAVAAAGWVTAGCAGVVVGLIGVVAGLALIHTPVAANFTQAMIGAAIAKFVVAVVAFLKAVLFGREVVALSAVATTRELADAGASVARIVITIIADFVVFPDHTITAGRWRAGIETLIRIDFVTVIAEFTLLHGTIAASRRLTVVAVIDRVIVGIVAAFAGADKAVAATRFDATGQTGIGIHLITVITPLIIWIAFGKTGPHDAVAAARLRAAVTAGVGVDLVAVITVFKTDRPLR
jgi:hypothetical protein